MVHSVYSGVIISKIYVAFVSLKIAFVLANCVGPMQHFIWVFTVCQSTHLAAQTLNRGSRKEQLILVTLT